MVEEKEKISLGEFKAWLVGMIRGKRGALPDFDDWVQIKKMIDKIEPDVVHQAAPIVYPTTSPVPEIYPDSSPQWYRWDIHWTGDRTWLTDNTLITGSVESPIANGTYTIDTSNKSLTKLFSSWSEDHSS